MRSCFFAVCAGLLFIVLFSSSCRNGNAHSPAASNDTSLLKKTTEASLAGNFSSQSKMFFDSAQLDVFLTAYPDFTKLKSDMLKFYRSRSYAYAWFDENGMIEQASNLYNHITNVSAEGLAVKIPYADSLNAAMENIVADTAGSTLVKTELLLTAQYFVYAENVWRGLSEKETEAINWYLPRKKVAFNDLLDSLLSTNTSILDSAPVYRQYGLLKTQLKKYRDIQSAGGFPVINAGKKFYRKGDSSAVIDSIRKYLFIAGDIAGNNNSALFDDELEAGIKNFQQRLGYTDDGIAGVNVINEMKVPVQKRIEQIEVNMERSRWVPVKVSGDYLAVNIPEYKLHVYENDSLVWDMNVVVGAAANKTTIFNGSMKYVVFSPYWNVPQSILQKEVLPGIKRNKNYLANHNMEWNDGNVRQKPGPGNSLGLVKFLFPNSYSIYFHDTPSKSLFNEDKRAFSHGCIRLSEPQKFAEYLLRTDTAWTKDKIVQAMNSGKEQYVTLKKLVPVFIAYFTAFVDRKGRLNFRSDVYGRDSRLAKMILDKPAL